MGRWMRDALLTIKDVLHYRRRYLKFRYQAIEQLSRKDARITFAGLFDTVEAFGVPIEELRRAIDVAIWPISFNNRTLSPKVDCARHALSLDDERLTFHPLRFDRSNETDTSRIKEVWFAGVHSDVGGGYPDCELALVPCVWMAEEARTHGLRFKEDAIEEIGAESSSLGPRHDSRKGASVFYRYAPRPLETSLEAGGIPMIHHSVAERMVDGSDNYAPLTLPHTAEVLLPNGQTLQIDGFKRADVAFDKANAPGDLAHHMDIAVAAVEQLKEPDPQLVERTLSSVLCRRILYFLMLGGAAVTIAWPWIVDPVHEWTRASLARLPFGKQLAGAYTSLDSGLAAVLDVVRNAVTGLLPGYLKGWADAIADYPVLTVLLIVIVVVLWRSGGTMGDRINDRARISWGLGTHAPRRDIGNSFWVKMGAIGRARPVRWCFRMLNTYVVPTAVILLLAAVAAIGVARAIFTTQVGVGRICQIPEGATAAAVTDMPLYAQRRTIAGETKLAEFNTADICWWTGFTVEKGRKYTIGIEIKDHWFDRTVIASPYGFEAPDWKFTASVPFRRWVNAKWFAPVVKIDAVDTYEQVLRPINGASPDTEPRRATIDDSQLGTFEPLTNLKNEAQLKRANVDWNTYQSPQHERFVAEFVADNDGDLFLYVNDAVNLFRLGGGYDRFYRNNSGTAAVWLQQTPLPAKPPEPPAR
jgi:hypothetical protein